MDETFLIHLHIIVHSYILHTKFSLGLPRLEDPIHWLRWVLVGHPRSECVVSCCVVVVVRAILSKYIITFQNSYGVSQKKGAKIIVLLFMNVLLSSDWASQKCLYHNKKSLHPFFRGTMYLETSYVYMLPWQQHFLVRVCLGSLSSQYQLRKQSRTLNQRILSFINILCVKISSVVNVVVCISFTHKNGLYLRVC